MEELILHESGARKKYIEALDNRKKTLIRRKEFMHGEAREEAEKEISKLNKKLYKYGVGIDKMDRRADRVFSIFGKQPYKDQYGMGQKTDEYDSDGKKTISDDIYMKRSPYESKKKFNKMIEKKSGHGSELQKAITNRGKRTQNESIAVLLTEAALLLNDKK